MLASADPDRLRSWYERSFGITAGADRFLRFGAVRLKICPRRDVAARAAEPARVIVNLHVDDARLMVARLNGMGITWLSELEYREADGAWFATLIDPDGNYIQIIELTESYWARQRALFDNNQSKAQQGDEQTEARGGQ